MNSKVTKAAQILLGIALIVFGSNKFLNFLPLPEGTPEGAMSFFGAMINTGYLFYLVGLVEVVTGLLFLTNKWVPFGLILIAPVLVNILLFHLFLDMAGIAPGLILSIIAIILFKKHWQAFKPLFKL